ncbi:hypothetical protein [uncultured Nocardioides sp.]|uniref:hypothetical protein n=1 Tax=uncultured Nocardioides sp. TaxID=198441 RepID=UPI0026024B49|nr:hypothetical protein [uncultured Nocardioides sp.]
MPDREKRVREDDPAAADLDDVEGHGRRDLPGDEQPGSTSTAPAHDLEDRA